MNIFGSILEKAKKSYTGSSFYKWMESLWSKAYDFANPEQQDPIQRFLDDPKMGMENKQALFDNLKSWVPKEVLQSYLTEKYYKPTQFKETLPMAKPLFESTGKEWAIAWSLKAIWNIPTSLYNLWAWAVNIWSTVAQEWLAPTAGMIGKWIVKQAWAGAEALSRAYQEWGIVWAWTKAIEWAQKVLIEDPSLLFAPQMAKGAWTLATKGGKWIVKTAEKVAPKVVEWVKTWVQSTWEWIGKVTKSIVSQQSWLWTPSIESILKKPELQSKIRSWELSAARTLEEARSWIDQVRANFRETGKIYDTVRKSEVKIPTTEAKQVLNAQLEAEWLSSGWKLNLIDLPIKDRWAITQALKYIDEYKWEMTPQNALSIRQKLDDLINYKSEVWSNGQRVVQWLRAKYDEFLWQKLPWLKEIDAKYAPERQFWESIRKDIYKSDGTLKDNALSVISNITNKWNEARLARMEKIIPWIGEKVKALKAFDDIQSASGIKVWTYTRAATTWWLAIVNPALAIATWVATHPVVVARVLEWIGIASQKIKSILSKWKNITKNEVKIISDAIEKTPKSKVEKIINNLSYDPKTNKLTSKTLVKNGNTSIHSVSTSNKWNSGKAPQKTQVKKPTK